MVVGPDFSTSVKEADYDEVDVLLRAAFPSDAEARLVRQLRADGDMWHETKKPWAGRIGGYYALSRMVAPVGWACLAPVAVLPKWQSGVLADSNPHFPEGHPKRESYRGAWRFGSRMMYDLASYYDIQTPSFREKLPETIVVLGKPSFYARAGFSLERAQKLRSPFPLDHTLILRHGDDIPEAELIYPKAFSKL